jgi:hypothetical protein
MMRIPTVGLPAWRALLSTYIVLSGFAFAACGDASRGVAQGILSRTIPPGDTLPALSEPVRAGQSLQFTWDVETHMSVSDYAEWLKTRLKDFQVVEENGSDLHLGTLIGGDAYRLHVTLQAATPVTRVHVQLVASPD